MTQQPIVYLLNEPQQLYRVFNTVVPVIDGPDDGISVETYTSAGSHPIAEGLPSSFSGPPDQLYFGVEAKGSAQVVLDGAIYGPGIVTWEASGPVVFWNGTGDFTRLNNDPANVTFNDNIDRMLVNAVRYAADNDRTYGPIEVERVQFVQRYLTVIEDGDSGTNPGDFYITARITNATKGYVSELAGYYQQLQTANPGVQHLGDTVEVVLPKVDGFEFTAYLSYFEGDGTGTEFSVQHNPRYAYSETGACWARQLPVPGGTCVDATTTDDGDLSLIGVSGSPVDVDLRWQVRVE